MTNDENETARELINSALGDMNENLEQVRSPLDLARMVAASIRDDHDHKTRLLERTPEAVLLAMDLHELGEMENEKGLSLGGLQVSTIATCPSHEPDLIDHLHNTPKHYAYALAMVTQPENEAAGVIVLMATRDQWQIAAVAVDDADRTADAYLIKDGQTEHGPVPPDLAATLARLAGAVSRTQ